MHKTHRLKTVQPYYDLVIQGMNKFDLRKDDRDYEVGDTVVLIEYPIQGSVLKTMQFSIDYILRDAPHFGLMEGYCILSLSPA